MIALILIALILFIILAKRTEIADDEPVTAPVAASASASGCSYLIAFVLLLVLALSLGVLSPISELAEQHRTEQRQYAGR